ncbi:DUF418 domain-containing protein [Paraflavitalea sp. CAU 1676]|uniref:DUF418 domain-containing protein n=1 Tax=Paraflavitalea sp. CAU 1676 TaxID=3032598 RepID=UPI0023D9F7FA|nr:DUF418 domain-containing protein [Paraflavitalea sp. CAU 1676]MDF2189106.1 DUF418 domain-containing protein [Paraflavitalea sp. CAU 1676]
MLTSATALQAAPVGQSERIGLLDALRGFAILGILLMNIPGFGLPSGVGFDPSLWNEFGSANFSLWYYVNLIPEGTQRAIFSMLFGAGIILFSTRAEKKLDGSLPADYFLRRQLWLMVFGLIDVWIFLWFGDILFDYACLGIVMFAFRRLPGKHLLIGAAICLLLMMGRETRDLYKDKAMIATGEAIAAIDTTKTKLTEQQKEQLSAMTDFRDRSSKAKKLKRTEKSIRKTTGSYGDAYEYRGDLYMGFMVRFVYLGAWDVLAFMFLGMALFKMNILTGQGPMKQYWIMTIAGLTIGLGLSWLRVQNFIKYDFNAFNIAKNETFDLYTLSRTARSVGLLGLLMLMYRSGWFSRLFNLMKPVGQMAFTNYLTQSILCGLIFYGVGFGLYGKLQRIEVYYVVLGIWVLQIVWSHLWLRYFNFGPFEWLWRSLTYWKWQPLRKQEKGSLAAASVSA